MKKFEHIDSSAKPIVFFALPELQYRQSLNAVSALLEQPWFDSAPNPAFLYGEEAISFATVREQTRRYAIALKRIGVTKGDRVIVRIEESPQLVFSVLAIQALGAIAVPTYSQLRTNELLYRIEDAGATVGLVSQSLKDELAAAASNSTKLKKLVSVDGASGPNAISLEAHLPSSGDDFHYAQTHRNDVALILYTSGSTNKPKGTCHSHSDLLAFSDTYARHSLRLRSGDVIVSPAAIPFAAGFGYLFLYPLRLGATAILLSDKSPASLVDAAQRHRATILMAVPTYYNRLNKVLAKQEKRLATLRIAISAGEPLPQSVSEEWERITGWRLRQALGTTELLAVFIADDGVLPCKRGAMGHGVPGYEVTVRDPETLEILDRMEHGLLCVRGATGTNYLNKPDAQKALVRQGWNVFPDLVYQDESGAFHYVSRSDEMIVSGGHSISPSEVEQILLRHEAVLECACVPAPDPTGERPHVVHAYIVLRAGSRAGSELKLEIQEFFKCNGPPYMYPRLVSFVDALPKTINGKIMRSALRQERTAIGA